MTSYFGGKKRLAKSISEVILSYEQCPGQTYFEPFLGMGSVMQHIPATYINEAGEEIERVRKGNDMHRDLIAMWSCVQNGWQPPKEITSDTFQRLKKSHKLSLDGNGVIKENENLPMDEAALRAFVGFGSCWNNFYFQSANPEQTKAEWAYKSLQKCRDKMSNVILTSKNYKKFRPHGMLIYCDPPYKSVGTYPYIGTPKFDHDEFWEVMRRWSIQNVVLVSEREAPSDFISVWDCAYTRAVKPNGKGDPYKDREHLYKHATS